MAVQKKRGKGSYLHEFEKREDGGYVYTGKTWRADPAVRRRMLVKLWVLQIFMLLSAILPGFMTTAGLLNTFYVIVPYVFWLISGFVPACTLGSMTLGGNPLRNYVYERSVAQYRFRAMLPSVGAALTAFAMLIFLLTGGSGGGKALCLVCCAVQIAASFLASRSKIADIWKEEKV